MPMELQERRPYGTINTRELDPRFDELTIRMPIDNKMRIEQMARELKLSSSVSVMSTALSLLDHVLTRMKEDNLKLALVDREGKVQEELIR